jgi:hypothetical protein
MAASSVTTADAKPMISGESSSYIVLLRVKWAATTTYTRLRSKVGRLPTAVGLAKNIVPLSTGKKSYSLGTASRTCPGERVKTAG